MVDNVKATSLNMESLHALCQEKTYTTLYQKFASYL